MEFYQYECSSLIYFASSFFFYSLPSAAQCLNVIAGDCCSVKRKLCSERVVCICMCTALQAQSCPHRSSSLETCTDWYVPHKEVVKEDIYNDEAIQSPLKP